MNYEREKAEKRPAALEYAKKNLKTQYQIIQDLYKKADMVTGDKRKQLRKQANKILNEIADEYL